MLSTVKMLNNFSLHNSAAVDTTSSATTCAWVRRELFPNTSLQSSTTSHSIVECKSRKRRRRRNARCRAAVTVFQELSTSACSASSPRTSHSAMLPLTSSRTIATADVATSSVPTSDRSPRMNRANDRLSAHQQTNAINVRTFQLDFTVNIFCTDADTSKSVRLFTQWILMGGTLIYRAINNIES